MYNVVPMKNPKSTLNMALLSTILAVDNMLNSLLKLRSGCCGVGSMRTEHLLGSSGKFETSAAKASVFRSGFRICLESG